MGILAGCSGAKWAGRVWADVWNRSDAECSGDCRNMASEARSAHSPCPCCSSSSRIYDFLISLIKNGQFQKKGDFWMSYYTIGKTSFLYFSYSAGVNGLPPSSSPTILFSKKWPIFQLQSFFPTTFLTACIRDTRRWRSLRFDSRELCPYHDLPSFLFLFFKRLCFFSWFCFKFLDRNSRMLDINKTAGCLKISSAHNSRT